MVISHFRDCPAFCKTMPKKGKKKKKASCGLGHLDLVIFPYNNGSMVKSKKALIKSFNESTLKQNE